MPWGNYLLAIAQGGLEGLAPGEPFRRTLIAALEGARLEEDSAVYMLFPGTDPGPVHRVASLEDVRALARVSWDALAMSERDSLRAGSMILLGGLEGAALQKEARVLGARLIGSLVRVQPLAAWLRAGVMPANVARASTPLPAPMPPVPVPMAGAAPPFPGSPVHAGGDRATFRAPLSAALAANAAEPVANVLRLGPGARLRLDLTPDEGPPRTVDLETTRALRVGRDAACDLALADPKLSRQHFRLEFPGDGTVVLVAENARNGILLDGQLVNGQGVLREGSTIVAGGHSFRVAVLPPADPNLTIGAPLVAPLGPPPRSPAPAAIAPPTNGAAATAPAAPPRGPGKPAPAPAPATAAAAVESTGGGSAVKVLAVLLVIGVLVGGGLAAHRYTSAVPSGSSASPGPAAVLAFVQLEPPEGKPVLLGEPVLRVKGRLSDPGAGPVRAGVVGKDGVEGAVDAAGNFAISLPIDADARSVKLRAGATGHEITALFTVELDASAPEVSLQPPVPWRGGPIDAQARVKSMHPKQASFVLLGADGAVACSAASAVADGVARAQLDPGAALPRTLRVEVEDALGRRTKVEAEVVADKTPPTVTIDEPKDGAEARESVSLHATVKAASKLRALKASLKPAGGDAVPLDARLDEQGNLKLAVALPDKPGSVVLEVYVQDSLGNEATAQVTVKRAPPEVKLPDNLRLGPKVASEGRELQTYLYKLPGAAGDIELVQVEAGDFVLGSTDPDASEDEKPRATVFVDHGYWIARSDVTRSQYKAFCAASGRQAPPKGYFDDKLGNSADRHPQTMLSWDDAMAYAAWAGLALPTEIEWEKAGRGTDGRKYPWGNFWDPGSRCNFADASCPMDSFKVGGKKASEWIQQFGSWDKEHSDGYAFTSPVGSFPSGSSPCGALDMAGNVWQWCEDWYDARAYARYAAGETALPASGSEHVARGGAWNRTAKDCRVTNRNHIEPANRNVNLGFRVLLRGASVPRPARPSPSPAPAPAQASGPGQPVEEPRATPAPRPSGPPVIAVLKFYTDSEAEEGKPSQRIESTEFVEELGLDLNHRPGMAALPGKKVLDALQTHPIAFEDLASPPRVLEIARRLGADVLVCAFVKKREYHDVVSMLPQLEGKYQHSFIAHFDMDVRVANGRTGALFVQEGESGLPVVLDWRCKKVSTSGAGLLALPTEAVSFLVSQLGDAVAGAMTKVLEPR